MPVVIVVHFISHRASLPSLVTFFLSSKQIMYNIEKAHFILDEMVGNGWVVETNRANVLRPLQLLDKSEEGAGGIFKRS